MSTSSEDVLVVAGGIRMPGLDVLPAGPMRELVQALHGLYDNAGQPSLRRISEGVAEDDSLADTVSHEKVGEMLRGTRLPRWSKVSAVVRILAAWSHPRVDPQAETDRFMVLWQAANEHSDDGFVVSTATRVRSVYVIGGVTGETTYPQYEGLQLEQFCYQLGQNIASSGADLVVCSPFPDSADCHALVGYVQSDTGGTVHLHSPRAPLIEEQQVQLRAMLGRDRSESVKIWHYPGPEETDVPEAMAQAWILCQLMAIDHADVVVAVGGKTSKTANTILHLAEARRQPVVPFEFLGGAARRAFQRRNWERAYPGMEHGKLTDRDAASSVMLLADRMVTAQVRDGSTFPSLRTVFVSRARPDAKFAIALDSYLSRAGYKVLFGERELHPARTVEAAIDDAILRSDLFIVLWSRSYATSRYCADEIELALQRHQAGELRLWIISLDGSDVIPRAARRFPQPIARTPEALVAVVGDLLDDAGEVD